MPQPQLIVRSARAKELAHRLAKKEGRTIAQVVESALELYARDKLEPEPESFQESAAEFWNRIATEGPVPGELDIDLDALIRANRRA